MDIVDIAQQLEDEHRSRSIAAIPKYHGQSHERCVDCDDAIPRKRRDAIPGVKRCVFCQSITER